MWRLIPKVGELMFANLFGKTQVYMDDMLVTCLWAMDNVNHMENTSQILRKFKMRLNLLKCAFGWYLTNF